jgi:hypothetical protein
MSSREEILSNSYGRRDVSLGFWSPSVQLKTIGNKAQAGPATFVIFNSWLLKDRLFEVVCKPWIDTYN